MLRFTEHPGHTFAGPAAAMPSKHGSLRGNADYGKHEDRRERTEREDNRYHQMPRTRPNQRHRLAQEQVSTEGSVKHHDLKFDQGIRTWVYPGETIPRWPDKKAFRKPTLRNQEHILESPPLLAVSAALLLYSMGIVSILQPKELSSSSGNTSAYWDLRVARETSIQAFQAQIRLRSVQKQSRLDHAFT